METQISQEIITLSYWIVGGFVACSVLAFIIAGVVTMVIIKRINKE